MSVGSTIIFIYFSRLRYSSQKDGKRENDKERQSSDDEDEQDEEDDDSVDSDFSIDEDDEPRSDLEDEAKAAEAGNRTRPKRGQGVQTKAYQEPKRDKDKKIVRKEAFSKDKKKSASTPQTAASTLNSSKPKAYPASGNSKPVQSGQVALEPSAVRKLTRATTVTKTAETAKRQKERLVQHRKLLKRRAQLAAARKDEMRPLTQAEILEEAKITEKLNLESLKRFQEMELEAKKKARNTTRKALTGSYISYRSTSMPLIQEISRSSNGDSSGLGNGDDRICVDDEYDEDDQKRDEIEDSTTARLNQNTNDQTEEDNNVQKDKNENEMQFRVDSRLKQERTFITFSDYDTFKSNFPGQKRKETSRQPIQQKICPITRLPAKYFDPVTRLPYANLQAFRILREAYYTQLELKGDRNDPEVKEWLEWRQKCKGTTTTSNKNNTPVSKSNISHPPSNTVTPTPVLTQVNRPPAAFSQLLTVNNQTSSVLSQPSVPSATTHQATISSPSIVLKSQIVANNSSNASSSTSSNSTVAIPASNQQIATSVSLPQQGTIVTATTPQRGLSALAVAVRQQHLQQQLLQQQQQQQIIANLVTTVSPVSATAYLTSVTAAQSQNQPATGVQVVSTSSR